MSNIPAVQFCEWCCFSSIPRLELIYGDNGEILYSLRSINGRTITEKLLPLDTIYDYWLQLHENDVYKEKMGVIYDVLSPFFHRSFTITRLEFVNLTYFKEVIHVTLIGSREITINSQTGELLSDTDENLHKLIKLINNYKK